MILIIFISLLPSINSTNLMKIVTCKVLSLFPIFTGFYFQVSSLVYFHRRIRSKDFITLITFIEIIFITGCFMCLKTPVRAKPFGSWLAFITSSSHMSFFTSLKRTQKFCHTDSMCNIFSYYEIHYMCKVNQKRQSKFHIQCNHETFLQ